MHTLYNGRQIYPRGTALSAVPPEFRGVSLVVWREHLWQEWATRRDREPTPPKPEWAQRAAATPRDRYGWRGLKGTSFLG